VTVARIEYAKTSDQANVAYSLDGDGPIDLLYAGGYTGWRTLRCRPLCCTPVGTSSPDRREHGLTGIPDAW
jgi:hypothetical protein